MRWWLGPAISATDGPGRRRNRSGARRHPLPLLLALPSPNSIFDARHVRSAPRRRAQLSYPFLTLLLPLLLLPRSFIPSFLHSLFASLIARSSCFLTDFGLSNRAEGLRFKVKGHPRSPFLRQQQKPYWTIFISRKKKQSFLSLTHTHRPSSSAKRNAIETSIRARVNQRRPVMNALASLGLSSHPPLTTARPNPCTS